MCRLYLVEEIANDLAGLLQLSVMVGQPVDKVSIQVNAGHSLGCSIKSTKLKNKH